MNHHHN